MLNEDALDLYYKYAWTEGSELTLQDFLNKFKPSMVQNDGSKPWIWVRGSSPLKEDKGVDAAVEEATKLLNETTEKVESIKNDETIPIRSNKKTGAKSKKELREQVQAEATERLKEISIKHGYVSGKWLLFAAADKIDAIWSSIATSLVSGPLHSTSADQAKVSTSSEQESPHLVCIYIPDVYDKASVTEVMKILLRNHGVNLAGVKSNLYTSIGLDSKHASGIPSTIWKNTAILPDKESKELKDAYFADLALNNSAPAANVAGPSAAAEKVEAPTAVKTKAKPKLRKKVADDPFASDDDEDTNKEPRKPSRNAGSKTKRSNKDDGEDEEEERPKKKR
ncbi:translation initiation factor eIF 4e-like domain-containing protein [Crassisporium funariophilum]|nr:translation initiation factor eIF 4e-like domain-containing protein [Crassisporium funariophilum]